MSASAEASQRSLDRVLDAQGGSAALGEELFAIADVLGGSPSLRRALVDAGTPAPRRVELVETLFGAKVSAAAVAVVGAATALDWATSGAFVGAIDRQGVRAFVAQAAREGSLDQVENELFKLGRLVAATPELRSALGDRGVELQGRQRLLFDVVDGRVLPTTAALARRAVLARKRTFVDTLDNYAGVVADFRNRGIATVEVARPLTDEQEARLKAALARQAGRDVTLNVVLNPAVIGGVRVTLGDEVIEGTVAGRLDDARRQLS